MIDILVNYIILFASEIWSLIIQTAPYLLLGMLFSGLIYIFVDNKLIYKHIGSKNFTSIFKSTMLGIPIPLCSCGVIPVAATLRDSGASKGSTVSFIVSTPQTGIDSIFLTYGMLGPIFALFRPLAAFISGLFSGLVINSFDDESHHHSSNSNQKIKNEQSIIERFKLGFKYGFITLPADIVTPLITGLAISAVIAIFVPPNFIAQYFAFNSYFMFILMLIVSLPIYVCATASIPIAVALLGKGVSAGAVFVFLMVGPATNASSIAVVKSILGKKTMYLYLFLIAFTAIIFGIILDYFLVIELPLSMTHAHNHDEMNIISIFLTIVFILILMNAYFYKVGRNTQPDNKKVSKTKDYKEKLSIMVSGITCSHCKESIENGLDSFNEIKSTTINQQTGQVIVLGENLKKNLIENKIRNLGFTID